MRSLSEKEKKTLLKNKNVESVTDKHINFTSKFKISAIKRFVDGQNPREIFNKAKLSEELFPDEYIRSTFKRWKRVFFEKGASGFHSSKTGRPKIEKDNYEEMSKDELIAKVGYLEELNDFLKKLKALEK